VRQALLAACHSRFGEKSYNAPFSLTSLRPVEEPGVALIGRQQSLASFVRARKVCSTFLRMANVVSSKLRG
jgi:hypothetical protein